MQETMQQVFRACIALALADQRRTVAAREVRETRRKLAALLDVLAEAGDGKTAPRGMEGGAVQRVFDALQIQSLRRGAVSGKRKKRADSADADREGKQ